MSDKVEQEVVTFKFKSQQQLSANVHPLLFQFLSEHMEKPSHAQLSVREINNYRLHSLM
jgi:hypothetical protein